MAMDADGNLYIATMLHDELVKADKKGQVTFLDTGGLLEGPVSADFSVGHDTTTQYVTNFVFVSVMGSDQPDLGMLKKNLGVKGRELRKPWSESRTVVRSTGPARGRDDLLGKAVEGL